MKNSRENLSNVESVTTIFVNIGTIISWAFSIFTFFVLVWQPQPITLPGVLELSAPYKFIFLISIFLGYLQLLRRLWERSKRTHNETEASFGSYIYGSVIKFKRPIVFIGFLIIFEVMLIVLFEANPFLAVILSFVGFIGFVYALLEREEISEKAKKKYDDEYRKRWLKRIQALLYQDGFAHTVNFINLEYNIEDINWAIRIYFDVYEFEKDLTFGLQYIERNYQTYEICEIRFKHVESQLSKFQSN